MHSQAISILLFFAHISLLVQAVYMHFGLMLLSSPQIVKRHDQVCYSVDHTVMCKFTPSANIKMCSYSTIKRKTGILYYYQRMMVVKHQKDDGDHKSGLLL